MWRLTASLLVLALTSASPQGGYLPPARNPVCPAVTSVVYNTRIQSSYVVQTVNQINTQYITTTFVQRQVIPTTSFQTRVQTRAQYQTSIVQQTTTRLINRVVTQTIPSPPREEIRYVTTTQVVPQVNYITQTQVRTQVVPVDFTRTQIQTAFQPIVNYQTQVNRETQTVTIPGQDVLQTRVQTIYQTSVRHNTLPDDTVYVTSTQIRQDVQTQVIQGQNVVRTKVVQRERIIPFTERHTRYESAIAQRLQVVTRTMTNTQTQIQTQYVPQEVLQTQIAYNTIYTTLFQTSIRPMTRVQTVIRTQYVTPAPVIQTRQQILTSVVQVPGQDQIVNRQIVQTQHKQQIVYRTVIQPQQVTVTQTVTGVCAQSGYNYNAPSNPLQIGK